MILDDDSMFDVVALGELLVDFVPAGRSSRGTPQFEATPGGAPANVVSCLSRLGKKTAFIGKVGTDAFGAMLRSALEEQGILSDGLVTDPNFNTTLAFVHLDGNGERSFTFYRKHCADVALEPTDIEKALLNTRIFHFGSLSLTDEPARSATHFALDNLSSAETLVSYDPNLRPELWESLEDARRRILEPMSRVNILKLSSDELEFLMGMSDPPSGSHELAKRYGIKMIFVTMGAKGCYYRVGKHAGYGPAYKVRAVDSTGAGDAFLGGVLYQILEGNKKTEPWCKDDVEGMVRFANAIGALVTTRLGAFASMSDHSEIAHFVNIKRCA